MLKSLVDWEKCQRKPLRVNRTKQSTEEGFSGISDDIRGREDLPCDFDKLKGHKSTIEAAVSEVSGVFMQNVDITSFLWGHFFCTFH